MRVGLVFGGRSGEHEVSLQSARSIIDVLAGLPEIELVLIAIEKSGRWVTLPRERYLLNADDPKRIALAPGGTEVTLLPDPRRQGLTFPADGTAIPLDVVFPVLHGTYGEDGTIQGLFEMAGLPYVGASVAAAAVAMDKILSKRIFRDGGIPVLPAVAVSAAAWRAGLSEETGARIAELGFPVFVKPVNLGSSVGISRVDHADELAPAIEEALRYDTQILVERGIDGAREIECAVLGNDEPQASILGEIIPHHQFYSYEAKYLDPNGAALKIPAALDGERADEIKRLAVRAFQLLHCSGLARVDFLLDPRTGACFINEANTMPGFTKISMYPKLWMATGLSYGELVLRLLDLALERHRARSALQVDFPLP